MNIEDFRLWENGLSQGKESKNTRPLLANVVVAEFRRGYTQLFYKTNHDDEGFKECEFLISDFSFVRLFKLDGIQFSSRMSHCGISSLKKYNIIEKLAPLMPSNRMFYEGLKTNDNSDDLVDCI